MAAGIFFCSGTRTDCAIILYMYLDRTYKPRRPRGNGRIWWFIVIVFIGSYLYVRRPDWLVTRPLQPTPTPTRSAVSWQAEAESYMARGDFDAAITAYQQVARLEPNNADPLVAQALIHIIERHIPRAYELAKQAVEIDPENVDALNTYARVLDWRGEYEEAINFALDALDLDPENPSTLAVLGEIYSDVGNWPRAQAYISQALELDPNNVMARRNQAYLYELQGDYEDAIAEYDKAISLAPERADLYIEKGRQYQALAEWDKAIESYRQAVEVVETGTTLDALGWGLYLSGDSLEALRVLRRAVEVEPDYGLAVAHLGMAYYSRRNYEDAAPTLERAVELLGDETRIEVYYSLGLAYIYKKPKECDKAIPWLEKALKIDPDTPPALEGLSLCSQ